MCCQIFSILNLKTLFLFIVVVVLAIVFDDTDRPHWPLAFAAAIHFCAPKRAKFRNCSPNRRRNQQCLVNVVVVVAEDDVALAKVSSLHDTKK